MDSLTQAALGACIAGACAPAAHRRRALLAGAVLGTLPDLDVLIDYGGAVANFTYHRGFSHSLLVLAPFSVLLWFALRRYWAPVRESPRRWLIAISTVLITHPLLDAHTAYGTQLLWPLPTPPVSWSTLFIIDPLYTLPLVAAFAITVFRPRSAISSRALAVGLALSTLYLGWSWVAKFQVERHARAALTERQHDANAMFSTPTFFNTLLWRVVVLTDSGYLEGFDSLVLDEPVMRFEVHPSDTEALQAASNVWAVSRLLWFSRGFSRAHTKGDHLIITDLRMGQAPYYAFSHIAARRGNPHWEPTPTALITPRYPDALLQLTWHRIFSE